MVDIFLLISLSIFILSVFICSKYNGYGYLPILICCYFVFILITPAFFHVENNLFPFHRMSYDYKYQVEASIILLIFTIFFWIGFFVKKGVVYNKINNSKENISRFNQKRFYFCSLFILLILVSFVINYGAESFLLKRSEFNREAFGEVSFLRELIINSLKALSFSIVFYHFIFYKKCNKLLWLLSFTPIFCVFLIINFPLALSRFMFFSYIIMLLIYYVKPNFYKKISFFIIFGLGITTLFPLMSHVTRGEGEFDINISEYYISSGDFDSFQSIINVVIYVEKLGHTLGNQIVSSILSFVPRSFWISKGEPTGTITAVAAGYDYTNISSPLPAEFFIDFGYIGLILISFIFGYLIRAIDQISLNRSGFSLARIICLIFISLIVILSRGSILAVINTLYAEIFMFSLIYFLLFFNIRRFNI